MESEKIVLPNNRHPNTRCGFKNYPSLSRSAIASPTHHSCKTHMFTSPMCIINKSALMQRYVAETGSKAAIKYAVFLPRMLLAECRPVWKYSILM